MVRTRGQLLVTLSALLGGCSPSAPAPIPVPAARATPPASAPVSPPAKESPPATASPSAPATSPVTSPGSPKTEPPVEVGKIPGTDPALAALSRDQLGKKMVAAQQQGSRWMQQNKPAEGYQSFRESAKFARELRQRFPELSPLEQASLNNAFYNDACALAMSGDPNAAFLALQEATSAGFDDIKQLEGDSDLATVRALPEFETWRKETFGTAPGAK